jgi:hypothetical protein
MAFKAGDLITFYRRRNPGLGMILINSIDIIDDLPAGEKTLRKFVEDWNNHEGYRDKNHVTYEFIKCANMPEGKIFAFLQSNGFYNHSPSGPKKEFKNLKRHFLYIYWFESPSNWTQDRIGKKRGWFPRTLARRVSKSIKKS